MVKTYFRNEAYSKNINLVLLILRITVGTFMLTHGWGKFLTLIGGGAITFPDPLGIGETASLALAVFAEVFCSLFLILGFVSRLAAIPSLITMLVAAFVVHANDGFGGQELALLYGLIYLVIAVLGSGKYSIDNLIAKKISANQLAMAG